MNKKGVSIIGIVVIVFILSSLGIAAISILGTTSVLGVGYMQSQQAFYIAEAGKEWYLEQLENDTDWSDNALSGDKGPKDFAGGTFIITAANCQKDFIDIISTATIADYQGQLVQRVLSISVSRSLMFNAYDYAVYVGGNINTEGAEGLVINGNQKTGVTDFPAVNYVYYQSIADHVISGNYVFAAGAYSGIWYIDGSVDINSGVTLNGSIIATGQISMNGSSNVAVTATSPYPALVCEGNFHFQNAENITITGLIYIGANATGNFLSQKAQNINFTGTVMVRGNFNLQNTSNVNITYDSGIKSAPPPGFSGASTGQIIATSGFKEVL